MKLRKRLTATVLCAMTACSMLSGCSSSKDVALIEADEQIEITFSWWGNDPRHTYTIDAVREFEKQNPNIKVNLEYSEFTGFQQKTNVKIAAHTEADIMQLNYSWVSGYSPDGSGFYDLNKVSDVLNLNNYTDEALSYGMINGSLNALPIAQNGQVFIYNKTLYDKYGLDIPKSWADFYKAAEVMNKDGVYPMDLGSVAMWFTCVAYVEQQTGKEIITADNKFNFTQDDVAAMISFYVDWVQKGVVMEVSKRQDSDLSNGTLAGTMQWINSTEKYATLIEEAGESVVGTTPVLPGAARTGWYVRPATMYAMSANTAHPKEASMLLEFLVASDKMAMGQQVEKGIPFNQAAKSTLEKNNLLEGTMNDAADVIDDTDTILMNPNFENSSLSSAFYDACVSVLYGETDLQTAASAAYQSMSDSLK